ncbi:MAG: hypothetical protein RI566_09715 [Sediminimonas sp.]|uniref:hypothetical protein n=1 Tax=Sediminimonas sp. TaxID=2823379 RepID=UPI00286FE4D1|nr:hypothetical protein [Sediminimonas sp.]MDR9485437.1 hypothetical protein [Sediminimonas sp.]
MLEPSPIFVGFLLLKSYFYLPAILLLALLRVGGGRGIWVRIAAGIAAAVALIGLAVRFGPPLLGLYSGPVHMAAVQVTALGGGMGMPLLASAGLALSALPRLARWRGIDAVHAVVLLVLLGLWALAR